MAVKQRHRQDDLYYREYLCKRTQRSFGSHKSPKTLGKRTEKNVVFFKRTEKNAVPNPGWEWGDGSGEIKTSLVSRVFKLTKI